jgi:hypothetical protein
LAYKGHAPEGEGRKQADFSWPARFFDFKKPIFFWRKARFTPPYFDKNACCEQAVKILLKFPRKNLSGLQNLP